MLIKNTKDKELLEGLVTKYGKNKLEKIVEAFGSSRLRDIKNAHDAYNKNVRDTAAKRRNERINALNRYAYQRDEESYDKIGRWINPDNLRDKETGEVNRGEYEYHANRIQGDMNYEVSDKSLENFINIVERGFGSHIPYNLDKITDDDIQVFGADEIKKTRKYTKDSDYWVIYLDAKNTVVATATGHGITYSRRGYGRRYKSDVKFIDIANDADILQAYVVNVAGQSSIPVRSQRWKAQEGIIKNTPEDNKAIAAKNIERYKQIIAANGISKFDKIDSAVKDTLKVCISALAKNSDVVDGSTYSSVGTTKAIVADLTKLMNELLSAYQWFASYRADIREKRNDYWSDTDTKTRRLKEEANKVLVIIKKIDSIYA